mgnify:CR=1 FL=1
MSKKNWVQRQRNDPYVKKAQEQGWRARSAFKLLELDDTERLLRKARNVADLGAAPGAWCQVVRSRLRPGGCIFALDILPMEPLEGVVFVEGDFREASVLARFEEALRASGAVDKLDLVLSDMAPNISGIGPSDQAKSMDLAELALAFAQDWLGANGIFVVKVFQGAGFDAFLTELRRSFASVKSKKPKSSRAESREVYLVAKGLKSAD